MKSIIGNKLASKQNTKHNTDEPFLLRDRKEVSTSILFQKVCLVWKFSLKINWHEGIRMSWVEENRKNNSREGGRLLDTQE